MAPSFSYRRGEDAALALRAELDFGNAPIDIWRTLDICGVLLSVKDFSDGGDGLYLFQDDLALIVINGQKRSSRQRFTAAHELGHHRMHSPQSGEFVLADVDVHATDRNPEETEANAFAANLLAPTAAILDFVSGRSNSDEIDVEAVLDVACHFGLSFGATTWRLVNAGIITKAVRERLAEDPKVEWRLQRRGYDDAKAFPVPKAGQLPAEDVTRCLLLYENQVISGSRLGELLGLTADQAEELARSRAFDPPDRLPPNHDAVEELLSEL